MEAYAHISASGFIGGDEQPTEAMLEFGRRSVRGPRGYGVLARRAGVPIGAGALAYSNGYAYLFGASVLPAERRRGVQAALTIARLTNARERGATFACIQSDPGIPTERSALRMGFQLAYAKATLTLSSRRPDAGDRGRFSRRSASTRPRRACA